VALASNAADAALLISVEDTQIGVNGGRVEVFAEPLIPGETANLDNFVIIVDVTKTFGSGQLQISPNETPTTIRDTDVRHAFSGTIPVLFSSSVFNDDQSIEVLDSVGIFDDPAEIDQRELLTAFDVEPNPLAPLTGNETFEITINEAESIFFDSPFGQIGVVDLAFQSGVATVSAVAIPEPSLPMLLSVILIVTTLRSIRGPND
ncbi:MAG: hypothetical protein AAF664_17100, partial [Planctomycetota bacterium]